MSMTGRQLVESLTANGILNAAELRTIGELLAPEALKGDAETLAAKLVQRGTLTKYQSMNLCAGRGKALVLGDYVVLDKLGSGGMGQVFRARHRRMNRRCDQGSAAVRRAKAWRDRAISSRSDGSRETRASECRDGVRRRRSERVALPGDAIR